MKKFMVLALAVIMVAGFFGTASAANVTRNLTNANTYQVFASPVAQNGTTVYVLLGGPMVPNTNAGVALMAVEPQAGTSTFLGTTTTGLFTAGASAYGTPAVISGETVFVQVNNNTMATSGTSVAAINGATGATYYVVNLPQPVLDTPLSGLPTAATGVTSYAPSLTLDPTGTTLYGTSGAFSNAGTGVSIWRLRIPTGTLATFSAGVSAVYASPLLSGNSLYIIGDNVVAGNNSLIAYSALTGASQVSRSIAGASVFATPAISGNSIFVVDATGGLTAFNKTTLTAGANDWIQIGVAAGTNVTASPVTDGSYLVITQNNTFTGQAGVTVFDLRSRPIGGATGTSWWYAYAAGTTVSATPAISNGVLYLAVNETSIGGRLDRFNLAGATGRKTAPDYTAITTDSNGVVLGFFDYSSPIIMGARTIIVSNGGTGAALSAAANRPILYSFDAGAGGNAAWPQFKADAERKGTNTFTPTPVFDDDGDSGCFISIIK